MLSEFWEEANSADTPKKVDEVTAKNCYAQLLALREAAGDVATTDYKLSAPKPTTGTTPDDVTLQSAP